MACFAKSALRYSPRSSENFQEKLVSRIDYPPGQKRSVIVERRSAKEQHDAAASFPPHRHQHLMARNKLATDLSLSSRFDHIQGVEHDTQSRPQQPAAHKVIGYVTHTGLGTRQMLLNWPTQAKKQNVTRPVSQQNRDQPTVALPHTIIPQESPEGVGGVIETLVVPVILKQRLHTFERRKGSLGRPS